MWIGNTSFDFTRSTRSSPPCPPGHQVQHVCKVRLQPHSLDPKLLDHNAAARTDLAGARNRKRRGQTYIGNLFDPRIKRINVGAAISLRSARPQGRKGDQSIRSLLQESVDFVLALAVPPIAGGRRNQLQIPQKPYPVCTRIQRENCNISRNLIMVRNGNINRAIAPLPDARPYPGGSAKPGSKGAPACVSSTVKWMRRAVGSPEAASDAT